MMQSTEFAPSNSGLSGCGARLQKARQAAGLSQEEVANRLKMPLRVVNSLENDDPSLLGAPVFVRGQMRSYARLLGVDIEDLIEQAGISSVAPSTLVSHNHTPRVTRYAQQGLRRLVYIAITLVLAVPVWFSVRPHLPGNGAQVVQSLEIPETAADTIATTPPQRTPVVASMGSLPAAPVAPAAALSLNFNGESWVEIYAPNGRKLEQGLVAAGERRNYAAGEIGRIKLGDASKVEVQQSGTAVDLTPFSRANVARFTLSSDGSLAPVAD